MIIDNTHPGLYVNAGYGRWYLPVQRFMFEPSSISMLFNTTELIINGLGIGILSYQIRLLTNLKYLSLSSNYIKEIPEDIGQLNNLQILNLDSNHLTKLPKGLCKLINLNELRLQHNYITELPNEFGQLVNLNILDLSHNKLTSFPESCHNLYLEVCDVSYNKFKSIPDIHCQIMKLYMNKINTTSCLKHAMVKTIGIQPKQQWLRMDNEYQFSGIDNIVMTTRITAAIGVTSFIAYCFLR